MGNVTSRLLVNGKVWWESDGGDVQLSNFGLAPESGHKEDSPWIQTFSGKHFYFLEPTAEDVDVEDIAQALSKQCRFAGHINKFYSVAEHSLYVSYLAKNPLEGLLHDASEAYLVDMPSPIKAELPEYRKVEEGIMGVVAKKWGFEWPMSADTHDCDRVMLIEEATHLLNNCDWINDPRYQPKERRHGILPVGLSPDAAYAAFMTRYKQLTTVNKGV